MRRSLRITVAVAEPALRDLLSHALSSCGHEVAPVATGADLVACALARPDLIVAEATLPDVDGLEAVRRATADFPAPVVVLADHCDQPLLDRALDAGALAYLVKPVKAVDLAAAVVIAARLFEQARQLRQEAADLRRALEDRKVIEQAKGVVSRRLRVDEAEAYRRMQKLASARGQKLREVARRVLAGDEVFREMEGT